MGRWGVAAIMDVSGTFVPDAFISFALFNIFLQRGTNHWHRFKGWVKFDFFSI
jgi:hypothetical protein